MLEISDFYIKSGESSSSKEQLSKRFREQLVITGRDSLIGQFGLDATETGCPERMKRLALYA